MGVDVQAVATQVIDRVEGVILGKRPVVKRIVVSLLAGGHVLLEDVPGVGKTLLAKTLARVLGGTFKRIQFTPDLLPADITGVAIYEPGTGLFRFRPGPVFSNVVLADEINRASPKTQSALLESMEEETVSIDGEVHTIARPFLVLATQNPVEHEGVYPLPESQLDRFMMRLSMGYPGRDNERRLLHRPPVGSPLADIEPVTDPQTVMDCQDQVGGVHIDERLADYLLDMVDATRRHNDVRLGASPRAAMALASAARAQALVEGRDHVRTDDIQQLAPAVLAHRIILDPGASGGGGEQVIRDVLAHVAVP